MNLSFYYFQSKRKTKQKEEKIIKIKTKRRKFKDNNEKPMRRLENQIE